MWKWLEAIFKMFSKKKKSPKLPPDLPDEIPEDRRAGYANGIYF